MTVASVILNQLGGNRFRMMTGAFNLVSTDNSLMLNFKGSRKANKMIVVLEDDDTYRVEFFKMPSIHAMMNGKEPELVAKISGVYCDQLQPVFTSVTGLYTRI